MDLKLDSKNKLLRKLLLFYKHRDLTIEQAVQKLRDDLNIKYSHISEKTFESYIIPKVLEEYNITKEVWDSKIRKREIVFLSQMLMYAISEEEFGGYKSLSTVGRIVRNKDHATVLHAKKTVSNLLDTDKAVVKQYKELKHFLLKIIIN